jgi:predicted nucleotidyltransferase
VQTETPDFLALLEVLVTHDVEFVIVGAISAVLQGAPVMTFDLDIVHRRTEQNVARLLDVLANLDAAYRGHPNKGLSPGRKHLLGPGHQLLTTRLGPLDLLGAIEDGLTYSELVESAITMKVDEFEFLVLPLKLYVDLKARSPLEKDRARLPVLRETLKMNLNSED